jgi:oligoendopeptidase F
MTATDLQAAGVTWDLTDLYDSPDDPRIERDLSDLKRRATAFERRYRGSVAGAERSAGTLLEALEELEAIYEGLGKVGAYAGLLFSGDTRPPAHGALLSRAREASSDIQTHLLFLDLEWAALEEDEAAVLLADPVLERYRHHLIRERDFAPHRRPEGEERVLEQKANTGHRAFSRLFDETLARMRVTVTVKGEARSLSEEETLALLHTLDRETRRAAAEGLTQALQARRPLLAFILNTVLADHATDDRIRGFAHPMAARNLSNEISQDAVDALLDACDRSHGPVHDYYRLKARLLGIEPLTDYDRFAPVGEVGRVPFAEARRIVVDSFAAFAPQMGEIAERFFARRWIDAEPREGKQGGAFAHPAVPSRHPYVLLNYLGRPRDVMTLAHELGHGVHQWLSRGRGYLGAHPPLTTAETASVFGEMLVFAALKDRGLPREALLPLLCGKLEDIFSTVFRQVALTRFEQAAHQARRESGEIPPDDLDRMWMDANRPMFGDALELTDGYGSWWSYIPHFIHTPFYCYAYAFGELLTLSLYARYLDEGAAFAPRYLELLAAGGTDRPEALLAKAGVDLTAPGFWDGGLEVIGEWVSEARTLAGTPEEAPPEGTG